MDSMTVTKHSGAAPAPAAPIRPEPFGDEPWDDRGPWERFSWVFGVVWVVFMAFPITGALESPAAVPVRITAVALLVLYSIVYIAAYIWMIRADDWDIAARRSIAALIVMVVLMVASAVLIGPEGLGAGSFLISISMFSGHTRRAVTLATGMLLAQYIALSVWLSAIPNGFEEYGVLFMPPAIVFFSVALVRLIISAQERHDTVERQMVLVAERERVARDVHDVLGHSLTVVTVKAELAERLIDVDPERAKSEVEQIRSLSREALAEVRATVSGLRVARLGDELVEACSALSAAGIDADVAPDGDVVDPRHRIIVAWVLREAITNVVRHSRATWCSVTLSSDRIVVEDDGVGTPAHVAEAGLRGIRERVSAAGATLVVGPADASPTGTRLEVHW
ncbi:MAG: sensor histidine kinase [Candidatus Microbacterium stercoravium]